MIEQRHLAVLLAVKGKVNEACRRFCFHCQSDLMFEGVQAGKFIGIESHMVVCPACGKETGCFWSKESIRQQKIALAVMKQDKINVKKHLFYFGIKKDNNALWRQRMGLPDNTPVNKNGSVMDYRARGQGSFRCMQKAYDDDYDGDDYDSDEEF